MSLEPKSLCPWSPTLGIALSVLSASVLSTTADPDKRTPIHCCWGLTVPCGWARETRRLWRCQHWKGFRSKWCIELQDPTVSIPAYIYTATRSVSCYVMPRDQMWNALRPWPPWRSSWWWRTGGRCRRWRESLLGTSAHLDVAPQTGPTVQLTGRDPFSTHEDNKFWSSRSNRITEQPDWEGPETLDQQQKLNWSKDASLDAEASLRTCASRLDIDGTQLWFSIGIFNSSLQALVFLASRAAFRVSFLELSD